MERCVDELERFIDDEHLDCDKIRPGFLRVATTPGYVKRLQGQVQLVQSLGFDGESRRAVYSLGCIIGHGVAMCYLNGRVLAELLPRPDPAAAAGVPVREPTGAAVATRAARHSSQTCAARLPARRGRVLRTRGGAPLSRAAPARRCRGVRRGLQCQRASIHQPCGTPAAAEPTVSWLRKPRRASAVSLASRRACSSSKRGRQ
jgi:hypothetical protein